MLGIDLYSQLAERHGHYCPMSTLGLRLGLEAVRHLQGRWAEDWQFCYQSRTCAVDGIILAFESRCLAIDLQIAQHGQHLLHCRSAGGRELSLCLSQEAMQLANQYRAVSGNEQVKHLESLRTLAADQLIDVTDLVG